MIYLDYAASFPPFPEVISECMNIAATVYGNPGSIHSAGNQARTVLQNSRKTLAQLLHVRPEEIFFTSGATEANNWAVKMLCTHSRKKHIICSAAEHASVLASVKTMQRSGYSVTLVNPDPLGRICLADIKKALRPDTALLCVQAVNNETGVIQDVDALADLAHSHGVPYFCDAVQSFGHVIQNLHKADVFSLSAHKFGGPRGIGCLVIRYPNTPVPLIDGGGQESGFRSGTENLPGIAGFSLAAQIITRQFPEESQRIESLMQYFQSRLRLICPQLQIAGAGIPRSPGILCCAFPGITGEELAMRLDLRGICVSPGAACSARSGNPSHVLLSMNYTPKEAAGFVRFSLGQSTTPEDIDKTLQAIADILS